MKKEESELLNDKTLVSKIYFIRGQKVMLDRDLAKLYGVETKQLKRQVKRNIYRFPGDFMFELTTEETLRCQSGSSNQEEQGNLRNQFGTSSWGGARYAPMAFTEQGIIMLSSVLNSKYAIEVNIRVVRIFIRLREMISTNKEILVKLEQIENKVGSHDQKIKEIFAVLRKFFIKESEPREQIGYNKKRT